MRKTVSRKESERIRIENAQNLWAEIQRLSLENDNLLTFEGLLSEYGRHVGRFITMLAGADFIEINFRSDIKVNEEKRGDIFEKNPGCGK